MRNGKEVKVIEISLMTCGRSAYLVIVTTGVVAVGVVLVQL